jgi:hypothetical protein
VQVDVGLNIQTLRSAKITEKKLATLAGNLPQNANVKRRRSKNE